MLFIRKQLNDQISRNNVSKAVLKLKTQNMTQTQNYQYFEDIQSKINDLLQLCQLQNQLVKGFQAKNEQISLIATSIYDTDCKICFDSDLTPFNPLIYCDKCNTSFHKNCYNIEVPDEDSRYLCDFCKDSRTDNEIPSNKMMKQLRC